MYIYIYTYIYIALCVKVHWGVAGIEKSTDSRSAYDGRVPAYITKGGCFGKNALSNIELAMICIL